MSAIQQVLSSLGGAAGPTDPYFASVTLLIHMDGANGSTSFPTVVGSTPTPSGDAKISTAQSMFGGASAVFDGSGDYLAFSSGAAFGFGTADFTLEAFIWIAGGSGTDRGIFDFRVSNGSDVGTFFLDSGANKLSYYSASSGFRSGGTAPSTSAWHHIAFTRASGVFYTFLDGVLQWSATPSSQDFGSTKPLGVSGSLASGIVGSSPFNGYIDEVRITKGVARYTANFTPPSAAFPDS
jgi:hypothetical protein